MTFIPFDKDDWALILDVAKRRHMASEANRNAGGSQGARLKGDGHEQHKIGVAGEWAVTRFYGCHDQWHYYEEDEKKRRAAHDVGEYEVRGTDHPRGGLLVRQKDKKWKDPDTPYICIRLSRKGDKLIGGKVMGWLYLEEVTLDRYWRTPPSVRSPCWIAPVSVLRPMSTLPDPSTVSV